jgi:hypothetical protein
MEAVMKMRAITVLGCLLAGGAARAADAPLDTAIIERLTGQNGALDAKEGVFKVSLPRKDIAATIAGVRATPPLGLTAWAAFTKAGGHVMVMGDIVLLEDQVNPVMSAALDAGLEVTALHNHFFWDSPKIMFMHVGGMGDEKTLAGAVGKVFAKLRATSGGKGEIPHADIDPAKTSLLPSKIEAILKYKGELKDGVYKVVIGRLTTMGGHAVGKAMGVSTWAAFAGSDDKAVVDGDFAMLESELQPVLKAMRAGGVDVVAIHNHMTNETPRILFLHYWGVGRTEDLARALRHALDQTKHDAPAP